MFSDRACSSAGSTERSAEWSHAPLKRLSWRERGRPRAFALRVHITTKFLDFLLPNTIEINIDRYQKETFCFRSILNGTSHKFIIFYMEVWIRELLVQLGISVVTVLLAGWLAIKAFANAWLNNYFEARKQALEHEYSKKLAALEQEHAKQIKALEHRFGVLMDRVSKLHQFEFTVLPELWRKMSSALSATVEMTDPDRIQPSIRGMNEGELNTFLESAPLLDWEKWEIRNYPKDKEMDRDRKLANMLDWARYRRAHALSEELRSYLMTQSIFVSASLRDKLDAIGRTITRANAGFRRFLEERQAGREVSLEVFADIRDIQDNWMQMAGVVQAEFEMKLQAEDKTQ